MKIKLSDYENLLCLILDLLIVNACALTLFLVRAEGIQNFYHGDEFVIWLFINFNWLLLARIKRNGAGMQSKLFRRPFTGFFSTWLFSWITTLAFISLIAADVSNALLAEVYIAILVFGSVGRMVYARFMGAYYRKHVHLKRMVVVGVNSFSIDFVHRTIRNPEYGYKFLGFFGDKSEETQDVRVQDFDKIHRFLLEYDMDEVFISLPSAPDYRTKELIKFCHLHYIKVNFLNEFIHLLNKKTIQVDLSYEGPTPIVTIAQEPLEFTTNKLLKRGFDVAFSLFVIVFIFSWLFPIIGLAVVLSSPGPVFFKQRRTGLDNRAFSCYKFRTMRVNNESDTKQATANDSRITPVGAFLRKTSLDELPQFFNVLKGEMSVVGPRPHMLAHTRMYSKIIKPFMVRHWVKPGITGLAQAKGFRGETEEVRQMYHRVKMDVFYIQNWTFWMDVQLVFETIWGMVTFRNKGG